MQKIKKVMLLIETSHAFGRSLLQGISEYIDLHGPWICYIESSGLQRVIPRIDSDVDGIIARLFNEKMAAQVLRKRVPTIIMRYGTQQTNVPMITMDHGATAKMAAEHLLSSQLKNFAYCGYKNAYWSKFRYDAFRSLIEASGHNVFEYQRPLVKLQTLWKKEQEHMAGWLSSLPKPVGVFAINDDHSRRVLESCKLAGLHVPEDVAIIGADNDQLLCTLAHPQLTSIAFNAQTAGYEAAELLDQMMSGLKVGHDIVVSPTHVVRRQSTDLISVQDACVAEALRFIQQHIRQAIQVDDVVREVAISRRSLERHFQKEINRSIYHEIRRVRAEKVAQALLETNLSVSEIAVQFGYSSIKHIARDFAQEKGMSPLQFRKRNSRR